MEDVLDISADNLALLKEEAEMVDPEILMRYIRIFSELSNQIKYATQKRILIEINVIKLCKPEMEKRLYITHRPCGQSGKKLEKGVVVAQSQSPQAVR